MVKLKIVGFNREILVNFIVEMFEKNLSTYFKSICHIKKVIFSLHLIFNFATYIFCNKLFS